MDFIKLNLLKILKDSVPLKLSSTRFNQEKITKDKDFKTKEKVLY